MESLVTVTMGETQLDRLNEQAMCLLSKDYILVSAWYAMRLPEDDLLTILLTSTCHLDRKIQMLECDGQGQDPRRLLRRVTSRASTAVCYQIATPL